MRIRFFNTYEPVTALYRDLAPALDQALAEVEIVISRGEYRSGRRLDEALEGLSRLRMIRTINLGFHANRGVKAKAMVAVLYSLHAAFRAFFGPRADVNVFLSQPPLFSAIGFWLRLFRRQRYFCIVMDIQPELLIEAGVIKRKNLATSALSWMSRWTLRKADGVIVIGRCMAKRMEEFGVDPAKVHLIPNWADERRVHPVPPHENRLRRDQGWQDQFVVLYAGSIGLPQNFECLLEAAEALRERTGILFVFLGEGIRKTALQAAAQERALPNVAFLPFLHESYPLADILSAGDVHLVSLKKGCTGYAVPSKTYGILAAGRPLIYLGHPGAEIALMVEEEGVGTVVEDGRSAELAGAVEGYFLKRDKLERESRRARGLAEGAYSRSRAIQRYAQTLGVETGAAQNNAERDVAS